MRSVLVLLVALGSLVGAGCSAASGPDAASVDEVDASPTGDGDVPDDLAATTGGIGTLDRLRMAMVRPPTFDPGEVVLTDQAAVVIADLLYDGLTEVVGAEERLRPGLAAEWWPDDDFRRWTFRLDAESGVSADEVVASLAPLAGDVAADRRSVAALTADMVSVVADGEDVVIELAGPDAGLPWVLSGLPYSVVGEGGEPTGDFEIVDDEAGELVLQRRDARPFATGPDEVVVTWADRAVDAYRELLDGRVDVALIDPDSVGDAIERFDAEFPATAAMRFYVLNTGAPELSHRALRARIVEAVDPFEVVDGVDAGGAGRLAPASGLVAASAAGHLTATDGDAATPDDEGEGSDDDAGDEVDAASSADTTLVPSDALVLSFAGREQEPVAEALAAQLSEAGFPTSASRVSPRELAGAIVRGTTDLFAFGWIAPAGSADAVIPPLLTVDSPANVARLEVAEVTALLEQAAVTADDRARWELLDRAHRLALSEATLIPVATSSSMLVPGNAGAGLVIRSDGSIDLETVG